jgi:signal peptidase I
MNFLRRVGVFFLDITQTVVTSLAIFLMIYLFVGRPHQVSGQSMYPNFHNGDYILTNMIGYRFSLPERGDVVVFAAPASPGDEYIKRIIGIPGDRIALRGDRVYLNGELEPDSFLPSNFTTAPGRFLSEGQEVTVPQDQYFVLGDNRGASSDSRAWGFVPRNKIVGKAFFRYWPVSAMGKVEEIHF